jgi:hypothetical protein
MRRWFYLALVCSGIALIFLFLVSPGKVKGLNFEYIPEDSFFELKKGDILVRPNMGWLPGSCKITGGHKFGHVAVVTEGASGNSAEAVLSKAKVAEALFFDQATRRFQFKKENQARETNALVSFGPRFKGIRYRLRMDLAASQADSIVLFLRNQLDAGYNIFSVKKRPDSEIARNLIFYGNGKQNWNCATLSWEAFFLIAGVDIDGNKGLVVYPSDLITSKFFDSPGGRIRF